MEDVTPLTPESLSVLRYLIDLQAKLDKIREGWPNNRAILSIKLDHNTLTVVYSDNNHHEMPWLKISRMSGEVTGFISSCTITYCRVGDSEYPELPYSYK